MPANTLEYKILLAVIVLAASVLGIAYYTATTSVANEATDFLSIASVESIKTTGNLLIVNTSINNIGEISALITGIGVRAAAGTTTYECYIDLVEEQVTASGTVYVPSSVFQNAIAKFIRIGPGESKQVSVVFSDGAANCIDLTTNNNVTVSSVIQNLAGGDQIFVFIDYVALKNDISITNATQIPASDIDFNNTGRVGRDAVIAAYEIP